jgi:hypothetical protein
MQDHFLDLVAVQAVIEGGVDIPWETNRITLHPPLKNK